MDQSMFVFLLLYTLVVVGILYFHFNKTIKELKKESPTGTVTQDDAFTALVDVLTELIPEFVANYKSVLCDTENDETRTKIIVDSIVDEILDYIEQEKHNNSKIESVSKLIAMVPKEVIKSTIATAVNEFVQKLMSSDKEREEKILKTINSGDEIEE